MASIPLKKNHVATRPGMARFLGQWGMFFRQFVKHPGMIGSVIPSSQMLVDAMLEEVDWDATRLFVEYGPGVGTFTQSILERMHPDATLIAIDLNLDFVAYLEAELTDPRLRVVHGSAADVRRFVTESGSQQADYVLSGIPFSTLPDGVGAAICAETAAVLRPGGAFLVYQYSAFVRRLLTPVFARVVEKTVWKNIPPCRTFRAWREEALAKAA
ncbi:class I SAM-dependent methyltransferase [Sphingobium baderi]|uniref:Generic methyltransferase n=1 Tax=Sphingobium baderi LL03 TaxID=1114964 RepID=T0HG09_9SPHN|nr:methyltransferase domain-containing protein [Sphingobium baderi]EQA96478.1 generic methyltransferase [Sphingobium baderi LL03]KMS61001.1 generic methyltransferase [Sphingobium baderi LL03]